MSPIKKSRNKAKAKATADIPVIFFQEGNKVVAYSPALDICTYGSDETHARKRFSEAVAVFFEECNKMGTLHEVLEECGWKKSADKSCWTPPVIKSFKQEKVEIPG